MKQHKLPARPSIGSILKWTWNDGTYAVVRFDKVVIGTQYKCTVLESTNKKNLVGANNGCWVYDKSVTDYGRWELVRNRRNIYGELKELLEQL